MLFYRKETPACVRQFYQEPRGLNLKKPGVGQQKKRGYVIPETERELNKKEPFEGKHKSILYILYCIRNIFYIVLEI